MNEPQQLSLEVHRLKDALTVVSAMTSFPLRATTAEVQLESQECEQLLPMLAC